MDKCSESQENGKILEWNVKSFCLNDRFHVACLGRQGMSGYEVMYEENSEFKIVDLCIKNTFFRIFLVWKCWYLSIYLSIYLCCILNCVVINNEEYVYVKKYKIIFFLGDDTCVEQKSNRREFTHTKELSGDRRAMRTTHFSRSSGNYIVYNSHGTYNNSSLLPIGYLPKPGFAGVCIRHHHLIQSRPQIKVIFRYLRPDAAVSASTDTQYL